jgi:hypothetical protein
MSEADTILRWVAVGVFALVIAVVFLDLFFRVALGFPFIRVLSCNRIDSFCGLCGPDDVDDLGFPTEAGNETIVSDMANTEVYRCPITLAEPTVMLSTEETRLCAGSRLRSYSVSERSTRIDAWS